MTRQKSRLTAGAALAVAAATIPVQIAGGVNYPTVPPGLVILVVAAAAMLFAPWRWVGAVALLATVFLSVGALVAPNFREQLGDPGAALAFGGSVVQAAALVVALIAGVAAVARWRTPEDVPTAAPAGGRGRRG